MVPYFIWNGVAFLLLLFIKILGVYINHKSTSGLIEYIAPSNIIKCFIGNFNNQFTWQPINEPLWFIRDLYIMFLFYPIIYYILKYVKIIGIGILSIFYIFNLYGLPCLQIQTLYFFSIGIYIRMYNVDVLKNIEHYKIIILGIAIISFIIRYLTGNRIFMPTFIITFAAITVNIILHLQAKRCFTYIQSLKKYSFFIFAIHIIIIERLWFILYHPFFTEIEWLHCFSYVINPIFIITICSILYKLLEKTIPRFLSIITGSR